MSDNFGNANVPERYTRKIEAYYGRRETGVGKTEMYTSRLRPPIFASRPLREQLTPGGIAHLKGKLLKFDAEDAQQGIFFISGNQEVKADAKMVARNMPGELIFMVPATLKKGTCQVEVRTIGYGSKKLKIAKLAPALQVK